MCEISIFSPLLTKSLGKSAAHLTCHCFYQQALLQTYGAFYDRPVWQYGYKATLAEHFRPFRGIRTCLIQLFGANTVL